MSEDAVRAPGRRRDGFLDLIRALALVRVVIWHATGVAAVTLVAAIPVMFLVTGELFGRSAARHGAVTTLRDRLRRLAPPLWAFAALAWAAMAVGASASGTPLRWSRLAMWVVPVGDPAGSVWEGGWLATPLWYLRTLLWVMALAPLALWLLRRAPRALLAGGVVAVVALDRLDRAAVLHPPFAERLVWQAGDVVLYGVFFLAGAHLAAGGFARLRARHWAALSAVAAAATAGWWWWQGPASGVVNDDHVLHLLVGSAWVGAALAARGPLGRLAGHRWARPGVHLLGQRSLTIYLWHTTAIVVALWALERWGLVPGPTWAVAYAVVIVLGVAAAVVAFGWLEDRAARRGPVLWPRREPRPRTGLARVAPLAVPVAVAVLVAATVPLGGGGGEVAAFTPPVPSQAPPPPGAEGETAAATDALPPDPAEVEARVVDQQRWQFDAVVDPLALQSLLEGWAGERGISGAVASVVVPDGPSWAGAVGVEGGRERSIDQPVEVMSITKLFTANLVYRLVDAGAIGLDDPLPELDALPGFPLAGRVTIRQLLSHRTPLVGYRDTAAYAEDPALFGDPATAARLAAAESGEPGPEAEAAYSSTNYLVLGLLVEQLSGRSFDRLLEEEFFRPLGLSGTSHLPPVPGEPRFATAGVVSPVGELARAGEALLVDHVGISDESFATMTAFDPVDALGAGTTQYCPCVEGADGTPVAPFAVGYAGGRTLLVSLPTFGVVVAVDTTEGLWGEGGSYGAVMDLVTLLGRTVRPAAPTEVVNA